MAIGENAVKTKEDYKHMTTEVLVEKDRRLTELYWRISNEITMEDGLNVHERSTDLLEAIIDQITIIEGLMLERTDLLEWPKSIIKIYENRDKLAISDRR